MCPMSRLTFIAGGIPFKDRPSRVSLAFSALHDVWGDMVPHLGVSEPEDTTPKTDETFKERTAALHPLLGWLGIRMILKGDGPSQTLSV